MRQSCEEALTTTMGCCGTLMKYFLYLAVPVTAVLLYFHLECLTEKEQYLASKFNPEYHPDLTDCSVELSFLKPSLKQVKALTGI